MALIKCPKCNKVFDSTKAMGKKEVCEHCEAVFVIDSSVIYSEQKQQPSGSAVDVVEKKTIRVTQSDGEISFYSDDKGVRITNTRAIFGQKTYSMNNITSVSKGYKSPNRTVGALCFLIGGFLSSVLFALEETGTGLFFAFIAIVGIILFVIQKGTHTVRLGSASGEATALESKDDTYIQDIVNAVNEAIIKRG